MKETEEQKEGSLLNCRNTASLLTPEIEISVLLELLFHAGWLQRQARALDGLSFNPYNNSFNLSIVSKLQMPKSKNREGNKLAM